MTLVPSVPVMGDLFGESGMRPLSDRRWTSEAIRLIEADFNRSADTHLVPVPLPATPGISLYLKDESTHPTGSLKHRLARSLFLYGLCNGRIGPTTTIVEASSGSTAVSEAYFAQMLNLPFVAVMPSTTSAEKVTQITRYKGRCHFVDAPCAVYDVAARIAAEAGGHYMDQFSFAERATDWRGNNNIGHDNYGDRQDEGQYGLSWAAGGAFDVAPWLTVYGNRNMGFSAQAGVAENGMPLPPQGRDQSEVGARFYLFDKRLNITTSVYQLAQTNIAIANAIDPLVETLIAGQESKGFEFEAQGQIAPGLNVIASFTDQNSHYIDPTFNSGTVGSIPQFTGSLWAVYELQDGPLQGLSFGAGAQGTSAATESTTYITTAPEVIPGYVIANAAIGYRRDKYDLNLKINNVLDKTYYYSSASIGNQPVIVGEGRNFLLVAKYHF